MNRFKYANSLKDPDPIEGLVRVTDWIYPSKLLRFGKVKYISHNFTIVPHPARIILAKHWLESHRKFVNGTIRKNQKGQCAVFRRKEDIEL